MSNDDNGDADHGTVGADGPAGTGSAGHTGTDPSAGITNPTTNEGPKGALQQDNGNRRASARGTDWPPHTLTRRWSIMIPRAEPAATSRG